MTNSTISVLAMAERVAVFSPTAHRLAERFWPGPLTIALPRQPAFESEALAGGDTVALRAPDHEAALAVIAALAVPVTATSANASGGRPPRPPPLPHRLRLPGLFDVEPFAPRLERRVLRRLDADQQGKETGWGGSDA